MVCIFLIQTINRFDNPILGWGLANLTNVVTDRDGDGVFDKDDNCPCTCTKTIKSPCIR